MSICPCPGHCEYNEFPRCGVHFCILPACLYPTACRHAITDEINRITLSGGSEKLASRVAALRAEREAVERCCP